MRRVGGKNIERAGTQDKDGDDDDDGLKLD